MNNTTLQDIDVVFYSINKYKEFKHFSEASKDEQELIKQYIDLNEKGYKETLEREEQKLYNIPEAFKKELIDCLARTEKIIANDFADTYYFIDKDKIIKSSSKETKTTDIIYVMTLEEM